MMKEIHQARWLWELAEVDVFGKLHKLTESWPQKTFLSVRGKSWLNRLTRCSFICLCLISLIWNRLDPQRTPKSCRFWHMQSQNIAAAWSSHHKQPFETLLQNKWHSVDWSTQKSFPVFDSIQVISFAENLYRDTIPVVTHAAESPASFATELQI